MVVPTNFAQCMKVNFTWPNVSAPNSDLSKFITAKDLDDFRWLTYFPDTWLIHSRQFKSFIWEKEFNNASWDHSYYNEYTGNSLGRTLSYFVNWNWLHGSMFFQYVIVYFSSIGGIKITVAGNGQTTEVDSTTAMIIFVESFKARSTNLGSFWCNST